MHVPMVDSPDAAATLLGFLSGITLTVRDRGRRHELAGRVTHVVRRNPHTVGANVDVDKRLFAVELQRQATGAWSSICTCREGPIGGCEHAAALAYDWLGGLRGDDNPFTPSPGDLRSVMDFVLTSPAKPAKVSFRQQWEAILAEKLRRPLTAEESAFLGRLSHVFHQCQGRHGWLGAADLSHLGFNTAEARRAGYARVYDGWWERAPADPIALWQYIAFDLESSGMDVPEFMRPVTDTAPIRARLQDRQRREAAQRWRDRFAQMAARPDVSPKVALGGTSSRPLELRLWVGGGGCGFEMRTDPTGPWEKATSAVVDRLGHSDPGFLAGMEATPATYAFAAICQGLRGANNSYGRLADHDMPSLVRRLLAHPLARSLVVGKNRQPLVTSEVPLVWHLMRSAQSDRDYEVRLNRPDGTPLPPTAMHLSGEQDLYVDGDTIYAGPPPLDGSSATAAVVPAESIERPEVLELLRRFGARLPPEIEARLVTVPLRVRIRCGLIGDKSSDNEILALEVSAFSDDGATERALGPQGWESDEATTEPAAEGGKIQVVDASLALQVKRRLEELKLQYDHARDWWARRMTRALPGLFLDWRESLPPEVEVMASGELATLLGAPVKARIDFSLIETKAHRDWFDLALVLKPEDAQLTPEEIALLLKARGQLVRLPGKGWRRLQVQTDAATTEALTAAGFNPEAVAEAALAGERHRFHAMQLAETALADLLPQRQAAELRARAHAIVQPEAAVVPASLRAELRPYQVDGFHFLAFLAANRLGGVLADDMGLGKTVQALAWLLWLAERQPPGTPLRALVVCPKSVMGNWEAETARFAPGLATVRFSPRTAGQPLDPERPTIVIANYTQLRLAAEYFLAQAWDVVILDEGQFIKTPTSKVAAVARELPGTHRVVLSGTPIENRLLDLWSLFGFALPGLLGTQAAFRRHYPQDNALALPRLRARVRHFLLRRTKGQVAADLPSRTEEDVAIELETEQAKLYQAELKRARAKLLKIETARQFDRARFNILASLLRLRQICCHPALVDSAHQDLPSAKLEALLERLEALRDEGHQVLVFSQFVGMLELIRAKLVEAEIGHLLLTGQTEDRDALVRQFQSDKSRTVFLLSLKAAGFGLNLTAASYVILYDPWWNPAVEAQAIDRTHRIGQKASVNAYRFIAKGTIEEKIRTLQKEKAALAGAIVQEESLTQLLDLESLRQILG